MGPDQKETAVTDIVEFLRARLDEEEQGALAANVKQDDPEWKTGHVALSHPRSFRVRSALDSRPIAMCADVAGDDDADTTGIVDGEAAADHIARWDPARVLAEVEAKRRIVTAHGEPMEWCGSCEQRQPCETLTLLALPYSDHPDYDPEWKPTV